MADNKKKKVDFREALQAQADKVLPKDKSKETITVDIGGVPTPVARGSMDDATWAKVKEAASPTDTTMKSKALDWPKLMSMGQDMNRVADSVVSKEEKALVQKMPEWDRAEFLRQRFKNHGYDVPLNTAEDERNSLKQSEPGPKTKAQGSPDEWQSMPKPTTPSHSSGQTEDDSYVGEAPSPKGNTTTRSASNTFSPLSQAMQMATGATGAAPDEQTLAEVNARGDQHGKEDLQAVKNAASAVGGISADAAKAAALASPTGQVAQEVDQRVFGDKPLLPDTSGVIPVAAGTSAQWTGGLMGAAGSALGMPNLAAKGDALAKRGTALIDNAGIQQGMQERPSTPSSQGVPPSTPAGPTPEEVQAQKEQDAQNLALKMAQSVGGGYKVAQVDPEAVAAAKQAHKDARTAIEQTRASMAADNEIRQQATDDYVARTLYTDMQASNLTAVQAEAKMNSINKARDYMARRDSAIEAARQAALEPTDPHRFWRNMDAGSATAGLISAAIYGFTGQGQQWLQRVDAQVEQDIRMQQADRASAVQGHTAAANAYGQSMQDEMALGNAEGDTWNLRRQQLYAGLKAQADILGAQTQNLDAKARAQEASVNLQMKLDSLAQEGLHNAQVIAEHENTNRFHNAMLRQQRDLAVAKFTEGGGKRPLPEAGTKLMDDYSAAVQTLREMRDKVKNTGVGNRIWQKFAQQGWTPGNAEEKALYNDYRGLKYKWMTIKARGALQGIEIAALDDMLPSRGQIMSDPSEQIGPMIDTASRDFDRAIEQQAAAGFDMRRYKAAQDAARAADSRNAAPSYASPK